MSELLADIHWVKKYSVYSLQIYFAGSLESQEELIRYGFQVSKSHGRRI